MGAHPYLYYVRYNSDVNAALQELREREFNAGRYNPVVEYPQFPFPTDAGTVSSPSPGAQHKSIRHAVKAAGANGTRSILDLDHVSATPEFNAVAPLPPDELRKLVGTEHPTHKEIEQNLDEVFENIERGQGVYIIVYRNDQPDELFFAGYSSVSSVVRKGMHECCYCRKEVEPKAKVCPHCGKSYPFGRLFLSHPVIVAAWLACSAGGFWLTHSYTKLPDLLSILLVPPGVALLFWVLWKIGD